MINASIHVSVLTKLKSIFNTSLGKFKKIKRAPTTNAYIRLKLVHENCNIHSMHLSLLFSYFFSTILFYFSFSAEERKKKEHINEN